MEGKPQLICNGFWAGVRDICVYCTRVGRGGHHGQCKEGNACCALQSRNE